MLTKCYEALWCPQGTISWSPWVDEKCGTVWIWWLSAADMHHGDGLVQERRNSIANALELRLSCTNPSMVACNNSLSLWRRWYFNVWPGRYCDIQSQKHTFHSTAQLSLLEIRQFWLFHHICKNIKSYVGNDASEVWNACCQLNRESTNLYFYNLRYNHTLGHFRPWCIHLRPCVVYQLFPQHALQAAPY